MTRKSGRRHGPPVKRGRVGTTTGRSRRTRRITPASQRGGRGGEGIRRGGGGGGGGGGSGKNLVAVIVGVVSVILLALLGSGVYYYQVIRVPKINVLLLGCNTSLDLVRGLGEVTNAYVKLQNVGEVEISDVALSLNSSDNTFLTHPDQQETVAYAPPGYENTFKLTADTSNDRTSSIEVLLTSKEGVQQRVTESDCKEIDPNLFNWSAPQQ